MCMSPFGSVGAMDGADAAYRDVFTAVPKGLMRSGSACDEANRSSHWRGRCIVERCETS